MDEYEVIVDFTSKRTFTVRAATPDDAALQAMRQLKADDPAAGPVGYVVRREGVEVSEQRAWGAKRKRS